MRVVLLGAGGMLARDIAAKRPADSEVVAFTHAELDVRDTADLRGAIGDARPEWVINASGYTQVDAAESDPKTAYGVNATAVGELARLCREIGSGLLHYSTDYVFDGTKGGFYSEDDTPNPLSVYGASKLEGERLVRESGARHLVVRSQWLFGGTGKSFVSTIWERAHSGMPTRASDDQFGCTTYCVDLARVSWELLSRGLAGTFHVANRGRVSRYMLARHVFDALGASALLSPCGSAEFPALARRPVNTPLSVRKVEKALNTRMAEWREAVDRYLQSDSVGLSSR